MDLFGRKAKARAEFFQSELAKTRGEYFDKLQAIASLNRLIREQDQLLFQMSQCDSFERMRPYFKDLMLGVNARMQTESQRIKSIMIPELQKSYGQDGMPGAGAKLIEEKR